MNKIFLTIAFFLIALLAGAQTLSVRDLETGEPMPFVSVGSEVPKAYASTDERGRADISAFRGAESIEIRFLGYETLVRSYSQLAADSFELLMEPSYLHLDEVVVSATRWRQSSGNVPSKIISILPAQKALQNPQTAADLLAISGKVFIQKSQQGGGSPMIRGFATNRLLYAVDGVRMNTAIFRGGNIQNVISLDPFATESTEVLFGPESVIYGSDAIGGVMSFQTLQPEFASSDRLLLKGNAVLRHSTANDEKTAHFHIKAGWEKWATATSVSYWDYGHLRQGSHGPDDYLKDFYVERRDGTDRVVPQDDPWLQIPSAYSQFNLLQKVRFAPSDTWDLQYGFHYSETSSYGRYDRHNRLRNGNPRYAEWDYGPQGWMMNHLTAIHEEEQGWFDQVRLRLAHQEFEESRISRAFNDPQRRVQTENVSALSANLDFRKPASEKHTIFYGLEWVYNDVRSTGRLTDIESGATAGGPSRYPQASWQSLAAYIQDEFVLSGQLTLQAGLRYNRFGLDADFATQFYPLPFSEASIDQGAVTGSIGGVYRPSDTWVLKANFGTAFRSPNVDDMGKVFDSEPGAVTVPNPDLDAEYAWNLDLGMAKVLGRSVKLDLTAYYTILRNAMVRRDFTLAGRDSILYEGIPSRVQAIQNAAKATVYGVQAGIEVKLPAGFGFLSDLNVQVGEEELDDGSQSPSRHAAPLFGLSRLTWKHGKLDLELNAMYQAERSHEDLAVEERGKDEIYAKDNRGRTYAPSWYTLNFKALCKLTGKLSLSAGIENITDRRYRPYSSGISGPGRNFVVSVRVGI